MSEEYGGYPHGSDGDEAEGVEVGDGDGDGCDPEHEEQVGLKPDTDTLMVRFKGPQDQYFTK